jgi:hypothetical protein
VSPLAHFGVYGALVEAAVALAVVSLFVWVWLRERRKARSAGEPAEMND